MAHQAEVLSAQRVVGMTITGASINKDILAHLQPQVVIVEEAAEVLEPQVSKYECQCHTLSCNGIYTLSVTSANRTMMTLLRRSVQYLAIDCAMEKRECKTRNCKSYYLMIYETIVNGKGLERC